MNMDAIFAKAQQVRLLILDVDGVLTSGILYYQPDGGIAKGFHIQDGLGIKWLQKLGIPVAILSAKESPAVRHRLHELNVTHIYMGHEKKLPVYEEIKKTFQLEDTQIAYMGDDLPDLPVLKKVGLALSVPHAPAIIKQHIDYITKNKAGKGAVREACELILKAQDLFEDMIQFYS
jgi:3-deoxy-D-manno-octulosonate 8-phosphate phosphatase (KDO 8-P phosphatase)